MEHTLNMLNYFHDTIQDYIILCGRGVKHLTRRMDTLITTIVLPVIVLLMFTYFFGGAITASLGQNVNYLNYVLPGILLMSIGFCATTTASGINYDITKGIVERFRTMPISRSAYLVGHIFAALIRNIIAILFVVFIAFFLGFRSTAGFGDWLSAMGILLFFAFTLTTLAIVLGLLASSPDTASAIGMPMMFLPYFTGAFVPISTLPKSLQSFCTYQPVNVVWKTISSLLLGGNNSDIVGSLLWCTLISVISLILGSLLFAKRVLK